MPANGARLAAPCTTRLRPRSLGPPPPQEFKQLEDAAFQVLEAVERTKAELEAKGGELAAIRADFEEKKKEVRGVNSKGTGAAGAET